MGIRRRSLLILSSTSVNPFKGNAVDTSLGTTDPTSMALGKCMPSFGTNFTSTGLYCVDSVGFVVESNGLLAGPKSAILEAKGPLFAISLEEGAQLAGLSIKTFTGINVDLRKSLRGQAVIGTTLTNVSNANSVAINANHSGGNDSTIVALNDILSRDYGLLLNERSNINGLTVCANTIESTDGDAIELNAPPRVGGSQTSISIIGNVLSAGSDASNRTTAGFGIGLAGAKGVAIVGNVIRYSKLEAFHLEDGQEGNVIVGNTARNLMASGFWTAQNSSSESQGTSVVGNSLKARTGNPAYGAWNVYSKGGSVPGNIYVGNRFNSFKVGLYIGEADVYGSMNAVENSDVAIQLDSAGNYFGDTIVINTPVFVSANRGGSAGKFFSDRKPKSIIGSAMKGLTTRETLVHGFAFPIREIDIIPGETSNVTIFEMPDLMFGRLIIRAISDSDGQNCYYSVTIKWDGKELILRDELRRLYGQVKVNSVRVMGGQILVEFLNLTPKMTYKFRMEVEFEGEYVKL